MIFKTLSTHPWWAATTLFTAGALLLITTRSSLQAIDQQYSVALEVSQVKSSTLELRRREKDFIQRTDIQYLQLFKQTYDRLNAHLDALRTTGAVGDKELAQVKEDLNLYSTRFTHIAEMTIELGLFEESGMHGQVRELAHELEVRVNDLPTENLLLQLRRAEQNFLGLRKAVYVERFDELINTLIKRAPSDPNSGDEATSLPWQEYSESFHRLVHSMQFMGLDEDSGLHGEMRTAAHRLEPLLTAIGNRASAQAIAEVSSLQIELLSIFLLSLAISGAGIALLYVGYARHQKLARDLTLKDMELRVTLESIGDAVIATDTDGQIQFLNRAAEKLTGWPLDQVKQQDIRKVIQTIDSESRQDVPTSHLEVLRTGRAIGLTKHTVLVSRNGAEREITNSAAPIIDKNKNLRGAVLVIQDVTDRNRLEAIAQQSKRLETVGLLAGGIAHDFNNLLTAIVSATELLSLRNDNDQAAKDLLEIISQSGGHAASLTTKLLALDRRSPRMSMAVDVHSLIEDTKAVINRTIDKQITFDCELNAASSVIIGDPSLLSSVFLNLAINASDAMSNGGRLVVGTCLLNLDAKESGADDLDPCPDKRLEITFKDDGHGMSCNTIKQIFEPYFTTKPQGTGLGLASSFSAIQEHRGTLTVSSEPGQGSLFTISLPITTNLQIDSSTSKPLASPVKQNGVVLIVDDQGSVRSTAAKMLESIGFESDAAHDGATGLAMLRDNPSRYVAVLLDMILPDILGNEVFEQMIETQPDLPIVMFSGYVGSGNIDLLIKRGMRGFLQKPFSRDQLQRAITLAIEPRPRESAAVVEHLHDFQSTRSATAPASNGAHTIQAADRTTRTQLSLNPGLTTSLPHPSFAPRM